MTTHSAHEPRILTGRKRVRYLKIIAVFKIGKGVLLLIAGTSLLVLNRRTAWLDAISDWADREVLLAHTWSVKFLLEHVQVWCASEHLRATGLLALFYCAVLFTEGIGVYLQKRWAEWLMVCATAALIPLEVRHVWHHPTVAAFALLGANCFIVWFLYRVLKRDKHAAARPVREMAETR